MAQYRILEGFSLTTLNSISLLLVRQHCTRKPSSFTSLQLHKHGRAATIYSKNGADFTRRFPAIATAVLALPVSSCIIDGELVAAGASGDPDFRALLHGRTRGASVYAFDLLPWRDHAQTQAAKKLNVSRRQRAEGRA